MHAKATATDFGEFPSPARLPTRSTSKRVAFRDALGGWIRRRGARQAVSCFADDLPSGGRVLDLGCGRGGVGTLLEREHGCVCVGCDVVATNDSLARFCLFDGQHLPFRSAAFNAATLVFVLHHAEDPVALLREAARVTRGPLLVLEDTPRTWLEHVWGAVHCWSFNQTHGLPWRGRVRTEEEWKTLFDRIGLRVTGADPLRRFERLPPVARTFFTLEAKR